MKINITTANAQMSGWHTISDAEVDQLRKRQAAGVADIYDQTFLVNLRRVSLTTARRKFHAVDRETGERI